jgi:HEPN domain-containing protein
MTASGLRRRRIATFLTLASEEMKAAEMLLQPLPRQSAFFQQQAAEKLLRAVLEVEGIPAGPTHNLRTLIDLLDADNAVRSEFLAVEEWSSAATQFRYPSGSGDAPNVSSAVLQARQERLVALRTAVESFVAARGEKAGKE